MCGSELLKQYFNKIQQIFNQLFGPSEGSCTLAGIAMMRVICLAGALWQGMAIPAIEIAPGAPWLQLDGSGDGARVSQVGMPSPRSRCRW